MNYLTKIGVLFLFVALLLSSCRQDEEVFGTFPPNPPTPEIVVNGTFYGTVIDETNLPIEEATVTYGTEKVTTDENGVFTFKNVEINTKGSLVKVEKDGYFYNSKFVSSKLNRNNFVQVKMIEKTLTGSFAGSNGGSVSTDDGTTIDFTENSIMDESGSMYSGNVNVYATWLDPTASDLGQIMPGDLRAINSDEEQQQLTTFGMIGVELEGDAGQALNIADGQTATIEITVPSEILSSAPSTIPLWHFDEATGYWIEEGEAFLIGDKYMGKVNHFSFWNLDVPGDFVFIEGIVTNTEGIPLANTYVQIEDAASGISALTWTDATGEYYIAVPVDLELIISIIDNCGEITYSDFIGPFDADAVIPTIAISTIDEGFVMITGALVDCDNNLVENGYLKVNFNGQSTIIPADANGAFSGMVSICSATTLEITGFDITNLKQSTKTSIEVDEATIDLGNVFVCEDLTELMNFFIGEDESTDLDPLAKIWDINGVPNGLRLSGLNTDPLAPPTLFMTIENVTEPGFYTPETLDMVYYDDTLQTTLNNVCENGDCDIIVEITTYEGLGGVVIGSFSGILQPNLIVGVEIPKEVSGTFRVLID